MLKPLYNGLKKISDYRVVGRTTYAIADVLLIATIATLVGRMGWTEIHNWAVTYLPLLNGMFPVLTSAPSADTISRIMGGIDKRELNELFTKLAGEFLRRHLQRGRGRKKAGSLSEIIPLDGKTVRGSIPRGMAKSMTHIVNAVCGGITLAAMKIKEKSNEITIIPHILALLAKHNLLKGRIVTTDAMGCQKSVAGLVIGYGANYLFCFKGNQGNMHSDVKKLFKSWLAKYPGDFIAKTYTSPSSKIGGEVVWRRITVVRVAGAAFQWLAGATEWAGIKTVMMVERFTIDTVNDNKETCEVRYFISSLNLPPSQMLEVTIKHWEVETMHQRLDCTYGEDKCKVWKRDTAELLSVMRKLGLNFVVPVALRFKVQRESLKNILKALDDNWDYLMEVMTCKPDEVKSPKEARQEARKGFVPKTVPDLVPARAA